jgi:peptidoglycan lytic transglycosylase
MAINCFRTWFAAACLVACGKPDIVFSQNDDSIAVAPADTATAAAAEALRQGRPWRATQLIAPVLADSGRRTPDALMVAAAAAAGWEGWREVDELLAGTSWLDSLYEGRGRVLLARASLEQRADSEALRHATASLRSARDAYSRGTRLVLLARAYDRLDQRDSARLAYERAAEELPAAADWLRLRAAGVSADAATRADDYARLASAVARARIAPTEAQARERTGDLLGAARAYDSVGAGAAAFRLRIAAERDSVARDTLRRGLVAYIDAHSGSGEARTAVEVFDAAFVTPTPAEQLVVGRSAALSGPFARAASAFAAAAKAGPLSPRDHFNYGQALARLDRDLEAARELAKVPKGSPYAADAEYQRARALLAVGRGAAARDVLRRVIRAHPRDTIAASSALLLLADLATDEGRDGAARASFLELARRYPSSPHAPAARFRAAIAAFAIGQAREAARELDTLRARYPRSAERLAAGYWSGRAWARAGDSTRARDRWREVAGRDPLSYYAAASRRRLGEAPWAPRAVADSFPTVAAVDTAMSRAALLERLGMDVEARFEYDALAASAAESPERLLATAHAFLDRDLPTRAIPLGVKLIERGVNDARVYRIIYPVAMRDVLAAEATERKLDPALVAGLIRQESSFNPRATSVAGARGLMQVMPEVGRQIARSLRFPVWDPVLLYQPDVNLQLGIAHLANLLRGTDDLTRVLAAYNAGSSRVRRWSTKIGADDPEIFTERIPFVETRDYVRIVQRNREMYAMLYEWNTDH